MKKTQHSPGQAEPLSPADVSGIIAMAWQDDTPFEAIALQFGLTEPQVMALMRSSLKTRSFRLWRMRVRGRKSKHLGLHTKPPTSQPTAADDEAFPLPPSPLTRASLG